MVFRNKSEKTRKLVFWILAGAILFFGVVRRIINFSHDVNSFQKFLWILLPRPWCAISCCSLVVAGIFNKQFLYNFSSIISFLCALIYFAYPDAGFNNKYFLFESLYSVATHSLLLITSISMITLKITDFRYKTIWKEAICLGVIFAYAFFEIYVLHIASDPMYFMPGNDVQGILGLGYPVFLIIYILFVTVYFNLFYIINDWKNVKTIFKKKAQ